MTDGLASGLAIEEKILAEAAESPRDRKNRKLREKRAALKLEAASAPKLPARRGPQGRPEEDRLRQGLKTWGLKVKRARIAKGLTQRAFAEILGICQPHVCNLEKGTFRPSEELRARIDKKLKLR